MKKIFIFVAAIVAMSCRGSKPDTKGNEVPCVCELCKACDSLDYYTKLDYAEHDTTWLYPHSENFDFWYDSVTVMLVEEIDEWPLDSISYLVEDLEGSKSFMKCIEGGFDGLCDFNAYPKRFGSDAVKVLNIDTDHPSYWVRVDVKKDWDLYQDKVDSFIKYLYEED